MEFDWPKIKDPVVAWSMEHGIKVLVIIVVAYAVHKLSRYILKRVIKKYVKEGGGTPYAKVQRLHTLLRVTGGVVGTLVAIVALLMILTEAGIAIGPLLAAAGVAGLAVSFGGQYLIKDLIAGAFILLENQYRVGDVVCCDDTCGLVENLTLRMTTLRDQNGTVHYIPHGEIKKVSNLSKDFARVNLDIRITYSADIELVKKVVNAIGKELAEDPAFKDRIITPPTFLRVDKLEDTAMVIKIVGDTKPFGQWDTAGELRARLKSAFEKNGIEVAYPQVVVHNRPPAGS